MTSPISDHPRFLLILPNTLVFTSISGKYLVFRL
uniref:Uncharacterized protein n=1 Tax=Lepeophtheirus salmonis TaxID=72036 RepID=A0A0K2VBM2_LEPSM